MSPEVFITLLVFLAALLVAVCLVNPEGLGPVRPDERLARVLGGGPEEDLPGRERISRSRRFLELLGKVLGARGPKIKIDQELARADIPLKGEEFLALTFLAALGLGGLAYLGTRNPLLAVVSAFLGAYLPLAAVRTRQHRRRARFDGQLADALVVMANGLRAGFSFLQAMDMVRKEMPDPIAREFTVALTEMNWGSSTEEALAALGERVKSEDLDLAVTAVLIQHQVGGSLAEILDNIAQTIRERVRIKGEVKTLTAQGRISGLIIGVLPLVLAVLIYVVNPEYLLLLFRTGPGLAMLGAAVLGEVLGVLIIRQIVRIEV
ncbi:MAG: type II secretion system F family protein [Moorellales bacterium]